MQQFWKWLMRANARGILVVSVLVLLLACGWWGRQEFSSAREPDLLPGGGGGGLAGRRMVRLGVLDYVRTQLSVNPKLVPHSPFRPSPGPRVVRDTDSDGGAGRGVAFISVPNGDGGARPVGLGAAGPDVNIDVDGILDHIGPLRRPRRGSGQPPASDGSPGANSARNDVTLTYHGIIKRPDGITVALVDDGTNSRFLRPGDEIGGLQVEAIGRESLRVRQAHNASVTLQMGVPVTFTDGLRRTD